MVHWYNGSLTFSVLHGRAGSGKTFLVKHFLQRLQGKVRPLLLAETNEAVAVLAKSVEDMYTCKTVCSALGLTLSYEGVEKVLKQKNTPDLSNFNLIIVDESSMLDDFRLQLLQFLGIRTLFIGHRSQLPPVNTSLSTLDKCISPVFLKNFKTFELSEEQRNKGELALFCREAESLIYKRGVLARKYIKERKFLDQFITCKDNLQLFVDGKATLLSFTNEQVRNFNKQIRKQLHGHRAELEDYIVGDKIIFRSPTAAFKYPLTVKETTVSKILSTKKNPFTLLTTNTKGTVTCINETYIDNIPVFEMHVTTNHFDSTTNRVVVYTAMSADDLDKYKHKLYINALYNGNQEKDWKKYHEVGYVFANIMHAYAMTIYCSQGSTFETVFVDDADIDKCDNPYLRKKFKYVAYSRASKQLIRLSK